MRLPSWYRVSGLVLLLLGSTTVFGEALPLQPGKVETYNSPNGEYTVEAKVLGGLEGTMARLVFKASGKALWDKLMPEPPSKVAIADDGNMIALTNWGWRDEGASADVEFYNREGKRVSRVEFGAADINQSNLKWVAQLAIAQDGSGCVIAEDGRDEALFSLFDCQNGTLKWERQCGYAEACEVKIDRATRHVAVATRDYNTGDMIFLLLSHQGEVIWQQQIMHNFSWEVRDYIVFAEAEQGIRIFDQNRQKYLNVSFPSSHIEGGF